MYRFSHRVPNFNPVGVLVSLGVTPKTYPFRYYTLIAQVYNIIELQVKVSAEKLNALVKEAFVRDMFDIEEYVRFPGYFEVMQLALSNPKHIDVYWDAKNIVQAKFVDTDLLGDVGDLQAIQQLAYPIRGDLSHWKGIYLAWLEGRDNSYADTVGYRLDLMKSFGVAPFWELIEYGNQQYLAYPQNGPKRTLSGFRGTYNGEMMSAYRRVLASVRALLTAPDVTFRQFETTSIMVEGKPQYGYSWKSRMGRNIFAIAGTERIIGNRLAARGYILGPMGGVLKKWSGWLPR